MNTVIPASLTAYEIWAFHNHTEAPYPTQPNCHTCAYGKYYSGRMVQPRIWVNTSGARCLSWPHCWQPHRERRALARYTFALKFYPALMTLDDFSGNR